MDLVRDEFATGISVVLDRIQIGNNFLEQALRFGQSGGVIDVHNKGIVIVTKTRLAHAGTFSHVSLIKGVDKSLESLGVARKAKTFGGIQSLDGGQVQVLNGQTFNSFGLVTERLVDQSVHGLDALDDESVLIDLATNDSNCVNVLLNKTTIKTTRRNMNLINKFNTYSPLVLARGARGQIALHTRGAKEVVHGESVAFVEIAVLDNLIDGRAALVAELRNGEKLGVSAQLLDGNSVDVVPGLALAARGTLIKYS